MSGAWYIKDVFLYLAHTHVCAGGMRGFMRKCGKFLLLAILAIVLTATLVACNLNESSQSGGGQGTGGGNVPVAETKPYGLEFEV